MIELKYRSNTNGHFTDEKNERLCDKLGDIKIV
jgi:hypothetical protein